MFDFTVKHLCLHSIHTLPMTPAQVGFVSLVEVMKRYLSESKVGSGSSGC